MVIISAVVYHPPTFPVGWNHTDIKNYLWKIFLMKKTQKQVAWLSVFTWACINFDTIPQILKSSELEGYWRVHGFVNIRWCQIGSNVVLLAGGSLLLLAMVENAAATERLELLH